MLVVLNHFFDKIMFNYGIKRNYKITPQTEAADFLEAEVCKFFNYIPKSKRQKYADVWIDVFTGLNVKTDNLSALGNKGRLCTAEINTWLKNENNNLKFCFIGYKNENMSGNIDVLTMTEFYIEEVEYDIVNQGKGLLQPKRKDNIVVLRKRISRKEWMEEFKIKYSKFVDSQIARFNKQRSDWCVNLEAFF
tara:strand:+ start:1211 stop:1786 length:576 start_codon:yes stop_codon:yes gene_type:complete